MIVGCLLRYLFPQPDSILYLTGTDQGQFVGEFNTLHLESLVGTEVDTTALASTDTREDVARCIRYRRGGWELSTKPPSRVELLISLLSPWSNGGCRYLWQARAETLRKYQILQHS